MDGVKGVYHINAVDEVTRWQVAGAVERISEAWLLPVLQAILDQFPFRVLSFHSGNGSEFINHLVAKLLNKLRIEQPKSRPRRSNDNGLVEAKNGAVIRKHMGYLHIQSEHANAIHNFYRDHLNPSLNVHRPCGQPELITDAKGKQRLVYRQYLTPCQTMTGLRQSAREVSDTEAARLMQEAKHKLFAASTRRRVVPDPATQTEGKAVETTRRGKRGNQRHRIVERSPYLVPAISASFRLIFQLEYAVVGTARWFDALADEALGVAVAE